MTQWIRIDCDMAGHPKVADYACLMGLDSLTAFGAIVRLFTWVKQYYPDGRIATANPELIVNAMGLTQGHCAAPDEGWDARADLLCAGEVVQESYESRMYVAQCVLYKSHMRRMYGRMKVAYAAHDASHESYVLCAVMGLYLAGLVRADGEVSGWAERQPNKGKKRAAGRSKQAVSAHKRWGHTPEKPGNNCSVCAWEFEHNPDWQAYAQPKNTPVEDVQPSNNVVQGRIKARTSGVQKMLCLQNITEQYSKSVCSNEQTQRADVPEHPQPVDNPVDNSVVASPSDSGTLFDHDPEPDQPNDAPADPEHHRRAEGPDAGHARPDAGETVGSDVAGRGDDGEPEGFQAFWESYPKRKGRRDGKRDARRNWVKLPKTKQQQAVDALAEYAKAAGKYPVNASRYLGQDQDGQCFFEDYLEPQQGEATRFTSNSDKRFGFDEEWGTW